jgi:carbamoyl-phosphate synthase large subunit
MASSGDEAVEVANEIGYPVLIRPSYVLGGRAMRVCFDDDEVREVPVLGRVLVDRFLEDSVEIDVDALCDGVDTYVAAVMQHVEEAGIHSGDSSCVLPAPGLSPAQQDEIQGIVRTLGRALGVVGLLNVQLALTPDGDVYVLEANPRASRTVPFVSKATGVQLVPAACRLAAGARIVDLGLPRERPPKQWSVKAAVLPFARFAGSDPVLGPEMRSTGEVMASAGDLPTALAKAERAAGRTLPHEGAVFLSIRPAEQKSAVPIAATLAGLGFRLYATEGTAATLSGAGLDVEAVRKLSESNGDELTVIDLIRRGRCDLVINTPEGRNARSDGYAIREAALSRRVPCITTISGAAAAVHAIANARAEQALSLQERIDAETRTA